MHKIIPFNQAQDRGDFGADHPWLVVGKGPSFALYQSELASSHRVMALNHAMRGIKAHVGHAIDIEVIEHVTLAELAGVEFLCLPWIPHVRRSRLFGGGKVVFEPGSLDLLQHAEQNPVLRHFLEKGRLVSYNFCSADATRRAGGFPLVHGHSFSAAVAVRLLAQTGNKTIRTLGVDGGSDYATSFADIEEKVKLQTTAQTSFDSQFLEIAQTINKFAITCGPLNMYLPAPVYVGCEPAQDLAFRVLAFSIHRHSSLTVRVERLDLAIRDGGISVPEPRDPANRGRTPFSFQRFAIPALCGYTGKAVYMDSDMLVVDDTRPLWTHEMKANQMVSVRARPGDSRPPQFSVMVIDAENLRWDVRDIVTKLDQGQLTYQQVMFDMATVRQWGATLPYVWNSLEVYEPGKTRLVHFTDMDGQPWLNPLHPEARLWCGYLLDAIREGAISHEQVEHEVRCGHVRPSLLVQIRTSQADPLTLPYSVLMRDFTAFLPPHRFSAASVQRWRYELGRALLFVKYSIARLDPPIRRCKDAIRTALSWPW
jgi:hypothetical protein